MAIAIDRFVRRAMVAHARRERPRECCWFVVGRGRIVIAAVPMPNVAAGTTRYRVDDREHIALRKWLRRCDPPLAILGVYHSHPAGPAEPSETDIAEALYPDWVHVIVGLSPARPTVRGFVIRNGRVRAVPLTS
jgi:proteasome lid subunit RPN8/RPN11